MISKIPVQYIVFIIVIVFASSIFLASSSLEIVLAKKNTDDNTKKEKDKDQLVVKARINLNNMDMKNTEFIRLTAFINGDDFKQNIPISSIDKSKKKLDVELKTDVDNGIVDAHVPDEFFVCAYQVGNNFSKEYNSSLTKFDCNEGDILNIKKPTEIELFNPDSQVYAKSQAVYQATLNNVNSSNSDTVKIKILAPLADKKDTKKLVIGAMIKGQIQSEVIEDVQAELDKSNTVQRTFTFDRKTDIGLIQVGDRYHACVSGDDLRPPEGTECEKRVIKQFDKANSLPAR